MISIKALFEQAQLAEASYANLLPGLDVATELQNAGNKMRFSSAQATAFVSQWRVVNHIPDTASGFSATLFERLDAGGNGTGEFNLAIRGTQQAIDLFRADAGDIFLDGIALDQLIDLYNYWQRLSTPAQSTYTAAKLVTLQTETSALIAAYAFGPATGLAFEASLRARADVIIDYPTRTVKTIQFVDSSTLGDVNLQQGVGAFQAEPSALSVSGHSLGGHLAMAFTRLFSGLNASALTVNGLGFRPANSNVDHLFALLGGAAGFDAGKIYNVFGLEGPEFAAQNTFLLNQVGGYQGIYIENAGPSTLLGHSSEQMTDSLAVYDLFAKLDPALNTTDPALGIGKITDILKAVSSKSADTLEAALDSLRKLFKEPISPNPALTATDNRQQFYQNLFDLQGRIAAGTLTIDSLVTIEAAQLAALAQGSEAFAYRYALKELNPFAVVGNNAIYNQHNLNGTLDLYMSPDTTPAGMTSEYVADRAAMLAWLNIGNVADRSVLARDDVSQAVEFQDRAGSRNIKILPSSDFPLVTGIAFREIVFGSDGTDILQGNTLSDRLYGGRGTDFLEGGAENDYLEGGSGLDVYNYNARTTLGFNSNDGNDTIRDSDGKGVLRYTYTDSFGNAQSTALAGAGLKLSGNQWQSPDGKFTYTKVPNDQVGSDLVVTINGDAGGSLTLKDYRDNDFGIRLLDQPAPSQTTRNIVGDFAPFDFDPNAPGIQTQTNDLGNLIPDSSQPGPRDDTLFDSAANDHIVGGAGRDAVTALRGGDDVIEAGVGADLVYAGAGNDRVFADSQGNLQTFIEAGETQIGSGDKGDFLSGGPGDDIIVGGAGNDVLAGGPGADILVGGGGNDYLLGDSDYQAQSFDWTVTVNGRFHVFQPVVGETFPADSGTDIIYAGAGDDVVFTGAGDDFVSGGAGDDLLVNEGGADTLLGEEGNDTLFGDEGNDVLDGGDDNDKIFAEGGSDTLFGGTGDDELQGGKGDDFLDGGDGNDILIGGDGNDTLYGGPGSDTLVGGPGKDTYVFNRGDGTDFIFDTPAGAADPEASVLALGPGISADDIKFRTGSMEIDLGGGDAIHLEDFNPDDPLSTPVLDSIQFADDTQLSYQDVLDRGFDIDGTENDDFIEGTAVTDRIDAKAGNDTVIGKAGDDTLLGGTGDDIMQGDAGNDTLEGDDGNDSLVGGFGDDALRGGEGNDELLGEDGNDVLEGGNGDDRLQGGSGDDVLNGGAGSDILTGSDGSDIYLFAPSDGKDTVDEQGLLAVNFADTASTDVIRFAEGTLPSAVALLRVSNGDLLIRYGQGDQVTIKGQYAMPGNAIERIEFADGTMIDKAALDAISIAPIEGTTGNEVIEGTEGDDTLLGLDGNDVLDGGSGNDRIEGGAGADTYLFYRGMGSDTLVDTAPASEEISTLKLEAGLTLDSIKAQRQQGDLFVGLRGTSDGVLIKGYYDTNVPSQHWQVTVADGTATPLEDVISRPDPLADVVALSAMQDYKQGILSSWNAESQAAVLPTFAFVRSSWSQTVSEFRQLYRPTFVQVSPIITSAAILDYGVRRFNAFTPVSTFQHRVVPTFVNQETDAEVIQTIGTPSSITITELHNVSLAGLVYGGGVVNVNTFSTNVNTTNTIFSSTSERWTPIRLDSGGPTNGVLNILHSSDYRVIEEITAGDSANTIYGAPGGGHIALIDAGGEDDIVNAGPDDFVYGNDGDDQIYGGNIAYGGNGDDYLSGGSALYGGAGNDTLTGGAFMAGGASDDSLSGQDGANVFFIDPSETGHDSVEDTGGTDQTDFIYAYYRSVGVADPGESERFGGRWGVVGQTGEKLTRLLDQNDGSYQSLGEPDHFYRDSNGYGSDFFSFVYRTQDDLRAEFNNLGFQYQAGDIRYIQPLPPAPDVKATDYAALEPFVASGVIEADTVKFGDGLSLNDVTVRVDPSGDFLNFSWGQDHGLQVALAADDDAIGTDIERYAFSDGTVWTTAQAIQRATQATEGDDVIYYTRGWDVGSGLGGNDQLYGNAGDDVLKGGAGDDVLVGGAGNDTLVGGTGSDTYVFNLGDGVDHIIDSAGEGNIIQFGAGITPDMLSLGLGSLAIHIGQDGDTIHLDNFDQNNVETGAGIDGFQFADGTSLTYSQLIARGFDIQGTEEDDFLSGTKIVDRLIGFGGNDFLDGRAGDDVLNGGVGDDTLNGGSGDDVLDGGNGADIFSYDSGDGNDTISDTGGIDKDTFDNLYYNSIGIFNIEFRRNNVGRYADSNIFPDISFATPEEGRDLELQQETATLQIFQARYQFFLDNPDALNDPQQNFNQFTLQQYQDLVIQQQQRIDDLNANYLQRFVFIEPLPPAPDVKATDYSALEPFVASGLIEADTVQFGEGLSADNVTVRLDPSGNFLNFSWDQNDSVQVALAGDSDLLGTGIERFQFADGTVWSTAETISRATQGTVGNDMLLGGTGNDVLTGGAGNDTLIGGAGNDKYIFNPGDGVDHIQDSSGNNTILFGDGITPDSISLGLGSLLLHVGNQGDVIHIDDFDPNDVFANPSIADFQFAGGTVLSYNDLIAKGFDLTGTAGDDTITGTNVNDRINGLGGNDILNGGEGNNTYLFDPGFGHDVVVNPSGQGSVQFTNGIAPSDITVSRDGLDLLFTDKSGNQVRVSNWYADANSTPIQQATFADGTVWDAATLDGMTAVVNYPPGLTLIGSNGKDTLRGGAWNDVLLGGKGRDNLHGGAGDDLLDGGKGNDVLKGNSGNDILEGGQNKDTLKDKSSNNLFNGGKGNDSLTGGKGNELYIGGKGDDSITTGNGQDIIAFNRGDGKDTLDPSRGEDNTLSLGGGIRYKDLALATHSKDLIVEVGKGEKIILKDWYASSKNESVLNLQVITDATADYDPDSSNPLLNKRVNDFDFTVLVEKYGETRKANKNLDHWSVMNSLLDAHLAGSDSEALGGDLAYQYGKNGTLAGIGLTAAQDVLNSPQFGAQAQTLRPLSTLQEGTVKLS